MLVRYSGLRRPVHAHERDEREVMPTFRAAFSREVVKCVDARQTPRHWSWLRIAAFALSDAAGNRPKRRRSGSWKLCDTRSRRDHRTRPGDSPRRDGGSGSPTCATSTCPSNHESCHDRRPVRRGFDCDCGLHCIPLSLESRRGQGSQADSEIRL